jgi:hypothetical protein
MNFRVPKLLSDEPAISDSFGAHKRIADALAMLIQTSNGGKSIRLDGAWGAGKSTVVRLLRTNLVKSVSSRKYEAPNSVVFLYDAWVHSGDHLRRAFLESLAKEIVECNWLPTESASSRRWQQKLASMAGKRKLVTKSTSPKLTWRARLIIAMSVTGAIFSPAVFKLIATLFANYSVTQLAFLTLLGAAASCALIYGISAADMRALLTRSTLEETTETVTDPEPSSLEFQEAFEELMSEVLTEGRKFVVVIDNLDRIGFDEAKEVWALLRSFLDNPAFRKPENDWFDRLWLLIPVADEARLLGVIASSSGGFQQSESSEKLLDKVFQVRMTLPLPMLRSWKEFVVQNLQTCFGSDVDGSYEIVARLMQALSLTFAPTPRAIIIFINELIALYTERRGDMPIAILAAYILSRGQIRTHDWQIPKTVAEVYFTPTMQQDFATLYLHAEKSTQSLYLLITPNLESALIKGDAAELREILETTPAASDVLDQFLISNLSGMGQSSETANRSQEVLFSYLRALTALTGHTSSEFSPLATFEHIRPRIDQVFAEMTELDLLKVNISSGLTAYLKLTANQPLAVTRLLFLLRSLPLFGTSDAPRDRSKWDVWSKSLLEIVSIEELRTAVTSSGQRIRLPISTMMWSDFCIQGETDSKCGDALEFLDIDVGDEELANWVASSLIPLDAEKGPAAVLHQGLKARGTGFFNLASDKVSQVIQVRHDLDAREALDCLSCLLSVSSGDSKAVVTQLAEEGILARLAKNKGSALSFTVNENFFRLAVLFIWAHGSILVKTADPVLSTFLAHVRAFLVGQQTANQSPGIRIFGEFILRIGAYELVSVLATIVNGSYGVLKLILTNLCTNDEFLAISEAELDAGARAPSSQILIGENAEQLRDLLAQVIEERRKASPPKKA